jgi:hypothetical protein
LRDSRIAFTSARGGAATIEVNELDLLGFATWAPDDPGRFRLDGDLNRIHIAMSGTATPFARSIGIDAKLDVTGIELGKIEKYSGPLGFNPSAGRVDVAVETKGSVVFPDGRIDAQLHGQAKLTGIDMATPAFGSIRLSDGTASLSGIRVLVDATGKIDVAGDAALDLGAMALRLEDGTEVGCTKATIALPALQATISRAGPPAITITPQLNVQALTLGGPDIHGKIATASLRLSRFDLDIDASGSPFTATGQAEVSGLDLFIPDIEPIAITADTAKADLIAARFAFPPGSTHIDGGFTLDATNPLIVIADAPPGAGGPPPAVRISATTFASKLPTLSVYNGKKHGTKVKVVTPDMSAERFRLEAPGKPGVTVELAGSSVQLKSADVDVVDTEKLVVSGRAGLATPRLSLALREVGSKPQRANSTFSRLALDMKQFGYRKAGPVNGLSLKGRITSDAVRARFEGKEGEPAKAIELAGLDLVLADFAAEKGVTAPKQMQVRLDLGLRSLEALMPGGSMPAAVSVHDVRLVDAEADAIPPGSYGFERLAIGKFDVSLTRRAPSDAQAAATAAVKAEAKTEEKPQQAAARTWPPKDLPVIRIGQLGLTEGGKISMIDQTLSPPAASTILLDTLSVQNVDSTNPFSRADVRVKARLDDTELTVDGWMLPFKPRPDFDLRAKVHELVLPSVNPYVASQIGLDIVEGRLIADASGRATAGQLRGEFRATVADLGFADRPEAGRDRVSRSIGVPLSTIIDLLEDPDGTIDIILPFEGDMLSPTFDYSDMIWSGLYRVLRALIVSPFKLVSASISLLAAMDGGGKGADAATAAVATAAPALAPLTFPPGEEAPGSASRDAIVGLRQTLQDRPKMRLSLCGVATADDLDVLIGEVAEPKRSAAATAAMPKLRELSRSRMVAVRDALTEGTGIDRARVPLCPEPHADPADRGTPRVELAF